MIDPLLFATDGYMSRSGTFSPVAAATFGVVVVLVVVAPVSSVGGGGAGPGSGRKAFWPNANSEWYEKYTSEASDRLKQEMILRDDQEALEIMVIILRLGII